VCLHETDNFTLSFVSIIFTLIFFPPINLQSMVMGGKKLKLEGNYFSACSKDMVIFPWFAVLNCAFFSVAVVTCFFFQTSND
jgi:hypothetical protein